MKHEETEINILRTAAVLHEDLRNYGSMKDIEKPLLVAGILIALKQKRDIKKIFNYQKEMTDGELLLEAAEMFLNSHIDASKKEIILKHLEPIMKIRYLNEYDKALEMSPIRNAAEYLFRTVYQVIDTYEKEDYLGRFYSEFMSYSGGDGQTLGIILTPELLTSLFVDLAELKDGDVVLDPCAGTSGFLVSALQKASRSGINCSVCGIELQEYMYVISLCNILIRDGNPEHIYHGNFLKEGPVLLQDVKPTVGFMNPPFSQGSKKNPLLYEISFIEKLLDILEPGSKCVVVSPQSSFTGKTKAEENIKKQIYQKHTLEGTISLNGDVFCAAGANVSAVVSVFIAGVPHPADKICKFINYTNDGYRNVANLGRKDDGTAVARKQELLDIWFGRKQGNSDICMQSMVNVDDDWLYSYFYNNDKIPTESDFADTVKQALLYNCNAILSGRPVLLESMERKTIYQKERKWKSVKLTDLFNIIGTKVTDRQELNPGIYPHVTTQTTMFGHYGYYDKKFYEGNVLTVESAATGFCAYQRFPFTIVGQLSRQIFMPFIMNLVNICSVHGHTIPFIA